MSLRLAVFYRGRAFVTVRIVSSRSLIVVLFMIAEKAKARRSVEQR